MNKNHLYLQISKLRSALDKERNVHENLGIGSTRIYDHQEKGDDAVNFIVPTPNEYTVNLHHEAREAFLVGQSDARLQALSILMLYLCSGLQNAEGAHALL